MESFAKLISALGALLWPVAALVAIWIFYPDVSGLLRRDNVKIKIPGGGELSSEKFSESVTKLVDDLQKRIGQIESRLGQGTTTSVQAEQHAATPGRPPRILWVDDNPENNALIISGLGAEKYNFTISESTDDALRKLSTSDYDVVVSDMGRQEGGAYNASAGLDLLRKLAQFPKRPKVAIFASGQAIQRFGAEARDLGADLVTNSPTEIANYIRYARP